MDYVMILGFAAAIFTTGSLFPQVVKLYRTKSTKDISATMYSLFSAGIFLWVLYGFFISDIVIIIANTFAFAQGIAVLALKFKYRKNERIARAVD